MLCNSWVPCSRDYCSKLGLTFHEQKDENWKIWLSFSTLVLTNQVLRIKMKCWRDERCSVTVGMKWFIHVMRSSAPLTRALRPCSPRWSQRHCNERFCFCFCCLRHSFPSLGVLTSIPFRFTSDRQNFEERGEIKYLFYWDHSLVVGGGVTILINEFI